MERSQAHKTAHPLKTQKHLPSSRTERGPVPVIFQQHKGQKSDPHLLLWVAAPTELEYSMDAHWPWTYKIHAAGELLSQQFSFCSKFYQLHWRSFNFFGQSARFIICMYFHALCLYTQWCLYAWENALLTSSVHFSNNLIIFIKTQQALFKPSKDYCALKGVCPSQILNFRTLSF